MSNKIYPIGIQNFESLRKEGYFYVDKTAQIYQLATTGKYYFLSRPRRFGKSLLISTIEAYFQGKKELFNGLAMETLEQEWIEHPILHLDLNAEKYDAPERLDAILNDALCTWEKLYGRVSSETTFSLRFKGIIQRAAEKSGRGVVVLVDEYDKPLLQAIGNNVLQTDFRDTLKAFYGVLKSSDRYIRFALLSGVTKFSKISVFSDLNNLEDLSLQPNYQTLCGISHQELTSLLSEEIKGLADKHNKTVNEMLTQLTEWYDGYHFSSKGEGIYNPFSLLQVMKQSEFGSYWFETGTPIFLVELLKKSRYPLVELGKTIVTADVLGGIDFIEEDPIPILYQSGYLTIKDYNTEFQTYTLGFPNREVEDGFTRWLLPYYTAIQKSESSAEIVYLIQEIRSGKIDSFMHRLQSFFADTPYELVRDLELHYQNVLFIIFKLLGFYTQAEYHTSQGRIDLLVKTDKYIYVMEFKLDGTAEQALQQINEKQYTQPFATDSRTIYKIGANFSNKTKGLEQWVVG